MQAGAWLNLLELGLAVQVLRVKPVGKHSLLWMRSLCWVQGGQQAFRMVVGWMYCQPLL